MSVSGYTVTDIRHTTILREVCTWLTIYVRYTFPVLVYMYTQKRNSRKTKRTDLYTTARSTTYIRASLSTRISCKYVHANVGCVFDITTCALYRY